MRVWCVLTGEKAQPGPGPDLEKYYEMWDRAAGTLKLKVENGQETHYEGFEDNPQKIWTLLEAAHVSKKPAMRIMPMQTSSPSGIRPCSTFTICVCQSSALLIWMMNCNPWP